MACGCPVRWFQADTRPLSSRRSTASCSWVVTCSTLSGPATRPPSEASTGWPGAAAAAPSSGPAPAGPGSRGSPSPRPSRRASRPRARTPRRRTTRGRSGPASRAPRTARPAGPPTLRHRLSRLRAGEQVVLGREDVVVAADLPAEHVVALDLELGGEPEQPGHRGQEDRRDLAAGAGPDEATDGLGEEQRRGRGRRVDADREPRYVDPLRHHAYGDQPATVAPGELRDPLGRRLLVREHDRRPARR